MLTEVTGSSDVMALISLISPVVLGVIGWLLKRMLAEMERRVADTERRIEKLEEDAVSKEDWLRESGVIRQRLDRLSEDLAELKGQNTAGMEIGAAIAALARREVQR